MKKLYFDCNMGAAGDMICAALFELVPDKVEMLRKLNETGIPGVEYIPVKCEKKGVSGTNMVVRIHGEEEQHEYDDHYHNNHQNEKHVAHNHHHHMTLADIDRIVNGLCVSDRVKSSVNCVYGIIAEAESKAHHCEVEEVHFHEVGAMDAIADITAACVLMEELNPEMVISTPIHVGSGTVKCAHGILPVPAPATANILMDIPYYSGDIFGELCTPTGAALLKYFVESFQSFELENAKMGRGMGKREFPRPSFLAAYLN
ncbi:LarC family nickel insertion protein [Blautia schinkii]|nr:LarC family nickel insertion protein [Blautia schinkii]